MHRKIYIASVFMLVTGLSAMASDQQSASAHPPAGLAVEHVPQFVMLGFDDNPDADAMAWIVDYLADKTNADGSPARAVFYTNGIYLADNPALQAIHRRARDEGHEIGNHTQHHEHGGEFTVAQWRAEMLVCQEAFAKIGITDVEGFRTPFLENNAATFEALSELGFVYDTTLEEGYQPREDGSNFVWPHTLDTGSPGNRYMAEQGRKPVIGEYPGLWEIPLHAFMVPPDNLCEHYGVTLGLRQRIFDHVRRDGGWDWDMVAGKITGLDWNVFEMASLDGPEFLAILKYTFDLRLSGNRAPLMVGGHTALYPMDKPDRRIAMEAFIDYVLEKPEVRLVTGRRLLAWMRAPVALKP